MGCSSDFGDLWTVSADAEGHSDWVISVSFSPDGTKLASGCPDTVKVWDVMSGQCLQTLEGHSYFRNISFLQMERR